MDIDVNGCDMIEGGRNHFGIPGMNQNQPPQQGKEERVERKKRKQSISSCHQ